MKILKVLNLQSNDQIGTKEMNQVVMCRMDDARKMINLGISLAFQKQDLKLESSSENGMEGKNTVIFVRR